MPPKKPPTPTMSTPVPTEPLPDIDAKTYHPVPKLEMLPTGLVLIFTEKDILRIWAQKTPEDQHLVLQEALDVLQKDRVPQTNFYFDFHLYSILHAKEIGLTARKTSVFVSIMDEVIADIFVPPTASRKRAAKPVVEAVQVATDEATVPEVPVEAVEVHAVDPEHASLETTLHKYKQLIVSHSVATNGHLAIFNAAELRQLTAFLTTTFFAHFTLYKTVLNTRQVEQGIKHTMFIDSVIPPPPLSAAVLLPPSPMAVAAETETDEENSNMHSAVDQAGTVLE
eukprot:GILK01001896.1.p1 GENE.GILK01001896.1~~GILK01001896.1.p1  ORF type:complete len:282 (-),score=49.03 GILK01001896.1:143-988(-)